MIKIVAIEHLTLDGVYQGPARPDEDTRDRFTYGGWAGAAHDPKLQEAIGKAMGNAWSLLVGRITYEDLYGYWPKQPSNAMTDALNKAEKFVCSTRPIQPEWQQSVLLQGNAADAVRKLKAEYTKTLVIFGSGVLVQSLMAHGLIDEYLLMIHPLVLGKGRRLFPEGGSRVNLRLIASQTTDTGVIVATYQGNR